MQGGDESLLNAGKCNRVRGHPRGHAGHQLGEYLPRFKGLPSDDRPLRGQSTVRF